MSKTAKELRFEQILREYNTEKAKGGLAEFLMVLFLVPILLVYGILAWGFVFMMMWNWFIVPLGVTAISLLWAYGIALTATLVTRTHSVTKNENDKTDGGQTFGAILAPWIILLGGWLAMYAMENHFPEQLPANMTQQVESPEMGD